MAGEVTEVFDWKVIASGDQGPGPRSRHCLVYDQKTKAAVLFGGIIWTGNGQMQSDTWELRNRQWSRIKTPDKPPARHRGAMVYDSQRGQSVLFGGQGSAGNFLGDTWIYSNGNWRPWRARWWGASPSPRCGHSLAFDEQHGTTVLFGGIDPNDQPLGDTWQFDGKTWRQIGGLSPASRRYAAFAYDPELKGCLLHGGAHDDRGAQTYGDAWLFRDKRWTRLGRDFDTDCRDDHGLAFHQGAKKLVMLEGVAGARGILVREADGWQPAMTDPLHPRHQCSPLTWDDSLGGLLMHGGEAHHGGPQMDATMVLQVIVTH